MLLTAITRDQIIIQIYKEKDLKEMCLYMASVSQNISSLFSEDVYHYAIEKLLEMDDKKLKRLYNCGVLKYYFFGIAKKSTTSKSSPFFIKNGFKEIDEKRYEYSNINDKEEKIEKYNIYTDVENLCNNLTDCKKKNYIFSTIFKLYFENKLSIRKIAKATGFSSSKVNSYLQQLKKIIKQKIDKNDYIAD